MRISESGFWKSLVNTGHAIGHITSPGWKLVFWYIQSMGKTTEKLEQTPSDLKAQGKRWIALWKASGQAWESWAPEERVSVSKQKGGWTLLLFIGSILAFCLPGGWALIPPLVIGFAWLARAHESRLHWHFDLVRWALRLPQLTEEQIRGIGKEVQ